MGEKENYFNRLNKIAGEVEKKQKLSYISWATAWEMTKKEFPTATYEIYETSDGFPFWESTFGIDVKVGVTINDIEHIVRLPVMDGANKAMTSEKQEYKVMKNVWENGRMVYENGRPKKEEVTVIIEKATQFDINKAIQRAFTKAMAMHGIGLYVYRGEDLPTDDDQKEEPVNKKDIPRIQEDNKKDTSQMELTEHIELFQSENDINHLGTLWKEFGRWQWSDKQIKWATEEKDKAKARIEGTTYIPKT